MKILTPSPPPSTYQNFEFRVKLHDTENEFSDLETLRVGIQNSVFTNCVIIQLLFNRIET